MNNLEYICANEPVIVGALLEGAVSHDAFDTMSEELAYMNIPASAMGSSDAMGEWLNEERVAGAWQPDQSAAGIMRDVGRIGADGFDLTDYLDSRGLYYDGLTADGMLEAEHLAMLDVSLRWAAYTSTSMPSGGTTASTCASRCGTPASA